MRIHPAEALSVALLDGRESQRAALCARLQHLGHECFEFQGASDVIVALSGGQRFGVLLAALQDPSSLGGLSAACTVLGIPVLSIVPQGQWGLLSSQGKVLESSGTLGADVTRMTDAELDWLVRALIQRRNASAPVVKPYGATVWGDYHFYEGSRHVQYNGHEIRLQPRQFVLALQLFRNVGRVVEREWLWKVLWRVSSLNEGKRALDACASSVRKRLALNGEHGFLLRAVYGQGYQLVEVQPHDASPSSPPSSAGGGAGNAGVGMTGKE